MRALASAVEAPVDSTAELLACICLSKRLFFSASASSNSFCLSSLSCVSPSPDEPNNTLVMVGCVLGSRLLLDAIGLVLGDRLLRLGRDLDGELHRLAQRVARALIDRLHRLDVYVRHRQHVRLKVQPLQHLMREESEG